MFARFEAALLAGLTWLVADSVPTFNVEPFCRAVASRAAPAGDKDICFVEEREARDQLVQQWSRGLTLPIAGVLRAARDHRRRSHVHRVAHLSRIAARRAESAREARGDDGHLTEEPVAA